MNLDRFLYLRHGQSEANQRGLMCGRRCNSRLTEVGREQARLAAGILGRTCIVGSICASAQETAQIVNTVLSVPIIAIEELAEWDVGAWDHQPFTSVRDEFLDADPPGGETRAAGVTGAKRFKLVCECKAAAADR
jgi:2,3-bisphosphoglycerate-dependent phosphoglycerate mutase